MQPVTVTRSVQLDAGIHRVWESLADGAGLSGWLADAVELEVAPGAGGRLVDAGRPARRVVVTEVAEGRRIGFAWWDEARPEDASSVTISLDGDDDATTVTVTEVLGAAVAAWTDATVDGLFTASDSWSVRLDRLAGAFAPLPVLAGR